MSWKTVYDRIHPLMLPGDVIAFGGDHGSSKVISTLGASTVSHVAIIRYARDGDEAELLESTVRLSPPVAVGVQQAPCPAIIAGYEGAVWWLPLNRALRQTRFDEGPMQRFLSNVDGRLFDFLGGLSVTLSDAADLLRRIFRPQLLEDREDMRELFCSELVSAALLEGGIVAGIEPSQVSPSDLCRWSIFEPELTQIKEGTRTGIPGYNSLPPTTAGGGGTSAWLARLRALVRSRLDVLRTEGDIEGAAALEAMASDYL